MSFRNRRQFLEESMLAAATAAAATAPVISYGQETQSSSPSEKLGVAVVGVRGRGGSHIGAFAGRKDTEILYICDADRDVGARRAEEVGKRQGGNVPTFHEDIRKVLEDDRVDIVSIATPNHWHALGAIWSMQAGKDVYVEKPVSHNVSEGRRIVETARKYNRICQTGTQSRSNPGMIELIKFVQSGKIGDVNVARGLCYKRRKSIGERGKYDSPSSVNYDLWLGPAPQKTVSRPQFHYDWHWQWDYGNGDLGNQGIHQMDIARWGLGVDRFAVSTLSYGGRFGYLDAGETANTQVVSHGYGEKSLIFEVRGLETAAYKGAKIGVIFEGTEGYAVCPSYNSGSAFDKDGNKIASFQGGGDHFNNFISAVRARDPKVLNADIEQGHLSSALCHLGNISMRCGGPLNIEKTEKSLKKHRSQDNVQDTFDRTLAHAKANNADFDSTPFQFGELLEINPEDESIVGNETASYQLSREYRKPFEVPAAGQV
ncbi:MAG: Gfo/Idh/MocA family oxidoreductase [Planctomycetota bacterium]|nr:Gfo/Idh/MocA family oxidoreductase [Planctomycetota bacterium]